MPDLPVWRHDAGYVTRNSRASSDVSLALHMGLAIGQRDGSQLPGLSVSSAGSLSGEESGQDSGGR
jgi:hypothetical protein